MLACAVAMVLFQQPMLWWSARKPFKRKCSCIMGSEFQTAKTSHWQRVIVAGMRNATVFSGCPIVTRRKAETGALSGVRRSFKKTVHVGAKHCLGKKHHSVAASKPVQVSKLVKMIGIWHFSGHCLPYVISKTDLSQSSAYTPYTAAKLCSKKAVWCS